MRLITTDLITAFPQLDPFPVEQRKKFLDRAIHPSLRSFAQVTIGVIALIACAVTFVLQPIDAAIGPGQFPTVFGVRIDPLYLLALLSIIVAALTTALGYFIRDRIIVQRLKEIFSKRGSCHACKHTLLGLPVPDDYRVTCPECGTITEVDPSLCELQSAADPARASITPRPTRVVTQAGDVHIPIWKQRTIRLIVRGSCLTLITILTVAAILFVIDELAIRRIVTFVQSSQRTYATLTTGPSSNNTQATPASDASWAKLLTHLGRMPEARATVPWTFPPILDQPLAGTHISSQRLFGRGSLGPSMIGYLNLKPDTRFNIQPEDDYWHRSLQLLISQMSPAVQSALVPESGTFAQDAQARADALTETFRGCLHAALVALNQQDIPRFELYLQSAVALDHLRSLQPMGEEKIAFGYESIQSIPTVLFFALAKHPTPAMQQTVARLLAKLPAASPQSARLIHLYYWYMWDRNMAYSYTLDKLRFESGPIADFIRVKFLSMPSGFISADRLKSQHATELQSLSLLPQYAVMKPALRTPFPVSAMYAHAILTELDDYTRSLIVVQLALAHQRHLQATGTITDDLKILASFAPNPSTLLSAGDWGLSLSFTPSPLTLAAVGSESISITQGSTPIEPGSMPRLPRGHQQLFVHLYGISLPLTPAGPSSTQSPSTLPPGKAP
jgi:hypothetical protein